VGRCSDPDFAKICGGNGAWFGHITYFVFSLKNRDARPGRLTRGPPALPERPKEGIPQSAFTQNVGQLPRNRRPEEGAKTARPRQCAMQCQYWLICAMQWHSQFTTFNLCNAWPTLDRTDEASNDSDSTARALSPVGRHGERREQARPSRRFVQIGGASRKTTSRG
jgi:hypothetical protein